MSRDIDVHGHVWINGVLQRKQRFDKVKTHGGGAQGIPGCKCGVCKAKKAEYMREYRITVKQRKLDEEQRIADRIELLANERERIRKEQAQYADNLPPLDTLQ